MVTWTHDRPGTPAATWASDPRRAGLPELALDADRLVVLAAHPDDESLGAGGLIAHARRAGLRVDVVAATDGEASHPDSPTHPPARLAERRRAELVDALDRLAPGATLHHLGLPDGRLADRGTELAHTLVELVGDGRRTVLVAPWRHDGHPDHDAAGRAAAAAADRTGATLWEYPIWFWHHGDPDAAPWDRMARHVLDDERLRRRAHARAAHVSQVEPLSDAPGDEVLLGADVLAHFDGPEELFVRGEPADDALDDLHADQPEPWSVDTRWYERRKRALLLALLPGERFRHGLEVGSSTGVLAADLAGRCTRLDVLDASEHAVARARERLDGRSGVEVRRATLPDDWPLAPDGGFDLVVLSEVGYFLSPRRLDDLVERVRADLAADGVLLLAHWRHPIDGWPLDGPQVHETVVRAGVRPVVATYCDRDVEVLVLADPDLLPDPQEGA